MPEFASELGSFLLVCSQLGDQMSQNLLMVFSMSCPYGRTFKLRCACLCSLYTPEPVIVLICQISFLLSFVKLILAGQNSNSIL